MASLIDCAGASAVAQASKRPPATSNLTVSYLAAGRVGPLRAEAEVLRLGQSHGVCNVRVYDNGMDNRFVATATVTVNFLDGTEFSSNAVLTRYSKSDPVITAVGRSLNSSLLL